MVLSDRLNLSVIWKTRGKDKDTLQSNQNGQNKNRLTMKFLFKHQLQWQCNKLQNLLSDTVFHGQGKRAEFELVFLRTHTRNPDLKSSVQYQYWYVKISLNWKAFKQNVYNSLICTDSCPFTSNCNQTIN